MDKSITSPSRTYVAICNTNNFDGYYCKRFTLPENETNDTVRAAWYFLNRLDYQSCVEKVIPFEDYSDIQEVTQ